MLIKASMIWISKVCGDGMGVLMGERKKCQARRLRMGLGHSGAE